MKTILKYKKPLFPHYTASQAFKYAENFKYLEHYNFGPYYVDDIYLTNVKILVIEVFNGAFNRNSKPLFNDYINTWHSDRDFPAETGHFIWVTYEEDVTNPITGIIEQIRKEGSLCDVLQHKSKSCCVEIFMDQTQAELVLNKFKYLVGNCVLLPDYFIVESMEILTIKDWVRDDPELADFIKKKKNASIFSKGDYTVSVKITNTTDISGNSNRGKNILLYDLLQKYQVLMTSKSL